MTRFVNFSLSKKTRKFHSKFCKIWMCMCKSAQVVQNIKWYPFGKHNDKWWWIRQCQSQTVTFFLFHFAYKFSGLTIIRGFPSLVTHSLRNLIGKCQSNERAASQKIPWSRRIRSISLEVDVKWRTYWHIYTSAYTMYVNGKIMHVEGDFD